MNSINSLRHQQGNAAYIQMDVYDDDADVDDDDDSTDDDNVDGSYQYHDNKFHRTST